jgi:hypothetical protein
MGLKLNGTHQLLDYADVVNLLGDNVHTVSKNTETVTDGTKQVGLEVNIENGVHATASSPLCRSKL